LLEDAMAGISRRETLKRLSAAPVAAVAFTWTAEEAAAAAQQVQQARAQAAAGATPYAPRFFTAHEYATVVALGDMIIPRDSKSGSASDAGAPEFIDYLIAEQPDRQTAIRGGLRWLDAECLRRADKTFLDSADADRRKVLDDIAWPKRAGREMSQGVHFFNTMRDLVATGFWSSKIGVDDLGYIGNRPVAEWTGAPANVLQKLGLG
jgi:gluconate 2-dehydrogenase gamma chain